MLRSVVCALLLSLAASLPAAEINVYAASSLTDALKEIGAAYEKESGDRLVFNFAASGTLARQIEEGAPADLFFSADEAQMDRVQKSGRIEAGTRRDLLGNALVVIAPNESSLALKNIADLKQVEHLAVGDPKFVPVGVYTRSYLERVGLWKELEPKIIPTENVRAGMALVESGNAEAGFVYQTDAGVSKKVKIIWSISPNETSPIRYPAALVQQTTRNPAAEKFLKHLGSDAAGKVFEKFGFIVPR